jgi:hypothetical protein
MWVDGGHGSNNDKASVRSKPILAYLALKRLVVRQGKAGLDPKAELDTSAMQIDE